MPARRNQDAGRNPSSPTVVATLEGVKMSALVSAIVPTRMTVFMTSRGRHSTGFVSELTQARLVDLH